MTFIPEHESAENNENERELSKMAIAKAAPKKWFYPSLDIVNKKLDSMYIERRCQFQVVTKDRVIEQWRCHKLGGEAVDVLVNIIKRYGGNHTILISELTLVATD